MFLTPQYTHLLLHLLVILKLQRCFEISYRLSEKQMRSIKKIIKDDIEQRNIGIVPIYWTVNKV